MEAMRTAYGKKREWVSNKQTNKQTKQNKTWNAAFVSRLLFVGTHYRIFVRKFLVPLRAVYASPQKLARPLTSDHLYRGPAGKEPRQQPCCALCSAWRGWWASWTSPALCWSLNTCSPSWTPCRYSAQGSRGWYTVRAGETLHRGWGWYAEGWRNGDRGRLVGSDADSIWDSEEVCRVRIVIGDSKSETIFWRKSVMSIHPSRVSLIDPVCPFRDAWSSSSTLFATLRWVGGECLCDCPFDLCEVRYLLACQNLRYWG